MKIKQFEIWLANLNPQVGTESGKVRPVVVVQTNLLSNIHPTTIICPISTNVIQNATMLRVHLKKGDGNIQVDSDVLVDQLRAIDNKRLIKKIGNLPAIVIQNLKTNIKIILDF